MVVQTIPKPVTPPPIVVEEVDRKFDWQKSTVYAELLKDKNLPFFKDEEGYYMIGESKQPIQQAKSHMTH